ncbi:MAG TPA: BadF/BadG/BcrA/BcrD ATPase family protein [Candidatus Dormibacteraeota bacterium]|nr:BadF/BadG/BcrA/BcrD ATPase family protein [Candidatus Dormibacteraeota bacterium]
MRGSRRPRFRAAGEDDHDPRSRQIPAVVLGLDIGGSSSRARLRDGDRRLDADGPGANVATLDPTVVDRRLSSLLVKLGNIRPAACCAGAAGAEVPAGRARLQDILVRLLPDCRVSIVHDARLVLAAASVDHGVALVAGTGSVAYGRATDGRESQRGGWGWMVGDDGSGVWITRKAAREVMRRADAGEQPGALGDALLHATHAADSRQLTSALHAMREPMQWAALAAVVFETAESDAGSREIIRRAAAALAALVRDVQSDVGARGPVVLAGGLLLHQPLLEAAVREELTGPCVRLEAPPVEGAVRLAEEMLQP